MNHRIERKRQLLTRQQKRAYLKFVKKFIYWTVEDWIRVIFTDKMVMQTEANVGQV